MHSNIGQVLSSARGQTSICSSAAEAEAMACLSSLDILCNDANLKVILERDCQAVVTGLKARHRDRTPLCFLLIDIKHKLEMFSDFRVQKVARQANVLAHNLAQMGRDGGSGFLLNSVPVAMFSDRANPCNRQPVIMQ